MAIHLVVISFNTAPGHPNLWILQVGVMTIMAPFQSGLGHGVGWIKSGWTTYFSMRDARVENDQLRTQRGELERQIIEMREKVKLLEQVESMRKWQAENQYEGVTAQVVARDANQLFNTVVIDKGLSSGVNKNQPVVTAEGLVGRVINVWAFSAQVLLLTDERHGAGAIIGQTGENRLLGVVKGRQDFLCEMRFIAPPERVENGEQVITSGQDGIYPKGLLIGRVKKPENALSVAPQSVEIEPAAPLGRLEVVTVLSIQPEHIHRPIDELTAEDKKQENTPDRKKK